MADRKSIHAKPQIERAVGWASWLLPILVIVSALAAYWSSFAGVFLFDDRLHILGDRRLTTLWPLWETLARKRPVVDFSLALNYVLSGERVLAYHVTNLTIHVAAALTLFGIVRRTLLWDRFGGRYVRSARWFALVIALLWVVHPLQTQSVTYIVQRAESLMGLFYLLTLYCVVRGMASGRASGGRREITNDHAGPVAARASQQDRLGARRAVAWYGAAVLFCALGMGSKAVMVTAPVVVLLYDRVFASRSFRAALRRRWPVYLGLASTWGVLWMSGIAKGVLSTTTRNANVGFSYRDATPWQYAQTQCGVLMEYLRLSLWPHPLCLDYVWPLATRMGEVVPAAIPVVALLGLVVRHMARGRAAASRSAVAFAGAWFFLILAPTSSFVPIKDPLFEHRMYLSLAAVMVLVVFGMHEALARVAGLLSWSGRTNLCVRAGLVVLATTALGIGTYRRNAVYQSEAGMWQDVRNKRPQSSRAAENLGTALLAEDRMAEAMSALREAVQIAPRSAEVHNGLGFALVATGHLDEAIESFREALRLNPAHPRARINLGNALRDTGHLDEAVLAFREALRYRPNQSEARLNLGNVLLQQGHVDEAIRTYHRILSDDPENASAWGNLGSALMRQGKMDEAVAALGKALQANPDSHNAHNSLGIALASQNQLDAAIEEFRRALALNPNLGGAHFNLAGCLMEKGNVDGAIRHYRQALKIQPYDADTHYELGAALNRQGQTEEAIRQFGQALQIKPDHVAAWNALQAASEKRDQP